MPHPPIFTQGKRNKKEIPDGKVKIPPPGPKRELSETTPLSFLLPAGFTIVGLVVMVVAASASSGGSTLLISMAISVPMMLGSYVVAYLNYRNGKRKYEQDVQKREMLYEQTLAQRSQEIKGLHDRTRAALLHNAPAPAACLDIVQKRDPSRMWARQPYHDDFLDLRLGIGAMPSHIEVEAPDYSTGTERDPLIEKARGYKEAFKNIEGVPIFLPLSKSGVTGLCGEREEVLIAVRALVLQIATHHSPGDVKIVAVYPAHEAQAWAWLRWLPHTWSDERDRRYLACEKQAAHEMLEELQRSMERRQAKLAQRGQTLQQGTPRPVYVFLLAAPQLVEAEPILKLLLKQARELYAYSIVLADSKGVLPSGCKSVVEVKPGKGVLEDETGETKQRLEYDKPDLITLDFADRFSRTLAPVRLKVEHKKGEIPNLVTLYEVLGIQRTEDLDLMRCWQHHNPNITMSVPVGYREDGDLQYLDIQEPRANDSSIDRWMGPNALIAGTVGSGKSELLRALLTSMAVHFHPREVVFVLLDFKPPGLVEDLIRQLPHTINTITDLDIQRVPRVLLSLQNELRYRMRLFDEAATRCGQPIQGLQHYMELYEQGLVGKPLPYLILVVDEFTRLKQELPEALVTFVKVAIVGRAFGFRMILATQKPTGVVTGQIDSNTQLRMCLKVAKAEDSREVIGDEGAAYFTRVGRVRWRYMLQTPHEFQCAYTGARYEPQISNDQDLIPELSTVGLGGKREPLSQAQAGSSQQKRISQYETLVKFISNVAQRESIERWPSIWLEPLADGITVSALAVSSSWDGSDWQPSQRWLRPVIGMLDDPANQSQPLLELDLARYGHAFICAGTTNSARLALRTLVEQLARDHSPVDVNFYFLDFGSAGLRVFESLPHTGAVIRLNETKRIARLFVWLMSEMDQRRQWLDSCGYATLLEYRASPKDGVHLPALVVVLDNLGALKDDFDLVDKLTELTSQGSAVGIHFIIAGDLNAAKFISKPLNNVKLHLALELDGKEDYKDIVGDYPNALFLPKNVRGRGLNNDGNSVLECQIATGAEDIDLKSLAQHMQSEANLDGYHRPHLIEELPDIVSLDAVLPSKASGLPTVATLVQVPLGFEDKLLPAWWWPVSSTVKQTTGSAFGIFRLSFQDPTHFLVIGPEGGGKTTVLYTWVLALAQTYPKEIVQFELIDSASKKSLEILRDLPHVRCYGATQDEYREILEDLKQIIEKRQSTGNLKGGPLILVIADNYTELSLYHKGVANALKDLAEKGRVWSIRFVVAGSSAQLSKTDPLIKEIRKSNSGILIGSHDISNDEGFLSAGKMLVPHPQNKEKLLCGRGYFVRGMTPNLIQVATPGDEQAIRDRVQRIAAVDQAHRSVNGTTSEEDVVNS